VRRRGAPDSEKKKAGSREGDAGLEALLLQIALRCYADAADPARRWLMPSRVIREGLLDSQRYWGVTVEARQLFVHLMLLADDFGLVSLAPVFVRRRCFEDAPTPAKVDKLIEQLHDADLLRLYTVGDGISASRYGFIPRFGQRLRMMRCKHPMPPDALFYDDAEAKTKFTQNKHLFEKLPAGRRQVADNLRPEVDLESETKRNEVESKTAKTAKTANQPHKSIAAQQENRTKDLKAWAAEQGIVQRTGETPETFQKRATHAYVQAQQVKHQ
jgi:hypothetical protein